MPNEKGYVCPKTIAKKINAYVARKVKKNINATTASAKSNNLKKKQSCNKYIVAMKASSLVCTESFGAPFCLPCKS